MVTDIPKKRDYKSLLITTTHYVFQFLTKTSGKKKTKMPYKYTHINGHPHAPADMYVRCIKFSGFVSKLQ